MPKAKVPRFGRVAIAYDLWAVTAKLEVGFAIPCPWSNP
jgi:hypothetical protein